MLPLLLWGRYSSILSDFGVVVVVVIVVGVEMREDLQKPPTAFIVYFLKVMIVFFFKYM